MPASALLGSSLLLAVLTEKPLIHSAQGVKLSLTLRGAAAGSVETHTAVLAKFSPLGLLLCVPGCKTTSASSETSGCSGALYQWNDHWGWSALMQALSLLQKWKKRERFS